MLSYVIVLLIALRNLKCKCDKSKKQQFSERREKAVFLEMADEFDIDDLLEAPYQKVKNEETEVNRNKVLSSFCFFFSFKSICHL